MKVNPLSDKVLVKRLDQEGTTKGGILIPENSQKKSTKGKVISVGIGKELEDGSRSIMQVKEDDIILLPTYGGTEVTVDDEEFVIVEETDILAIIS